MPSLGGAGLLPTLVWVVLADEHGRRWPGGCRRIWPTLSRVLIADASRP
ncbi:hypothetical protein I6J22_07855 [Corynebacterium kroppenstedtii]|nr:hypothetical protein [Corynebacterium kroppenstedtii]QRP10120.1 hypothetical protein I6J22_07855 [Corynebacterium kroppenstedtii]